MQFSFYEILLWLGVYFNNGKSFINILVAIHLVPIFWGASTWSISFYFNRRSAFFMMELMSAPDTEMVLVYLETYLALKSPLYLEICLGGNALFKYSQAVASHHW
jgi:hypothetical protein